MEGLENVKTDTESHGRNHYCMDKLGIVSTDLKLYGWTQLEWTNSGSYGQTRDHTDNLGVVRTYLGLYGRTRDRTDELGIIQT